MLEFVDWLIVSIRKFCTLLNSFGIVVSKLVLKLNFSRENNNYCNLLSRTEFLRVFITFRSLVRCFTAHLYGQILHSRI